MDDRRPLNDRVRLQAAVENLQREFLHALRIDWFVAWLARHIQREAS